MSLLEKMKQKVNYKNKRKRECKKFGENFISGYGNVIRNDVKKYFVTGGIYRFVRGREGVKAEEVYQAEKPDLVFMDITMPNQDGLETLKNIKTFDPNATIVMCSAMGQESMVMESIKSGAKDFIVKPFKPERILSTVTKILG